MPYIEVKTNTAITKEQEITVKSKIAEILVASFPAKTENWLMVDITEKSHMYHAGLDTPCAMIEVAIAGKGTAEAFEKMTDGLCALVEKELGIPADRVYVKYEEVTYWGWNGSNV